MLGTDELIFGLVGIVILLSLMLVVKVIRSRPTDVPDPWQTPLPMNRARQRKRNTRPMTAPPPPQMFRQR